MSGRPAVFLDRDGTLIADSGPVRVWRPQLLFGFVERALAAVAHLGFQLAVVTNQGAVARGEIRYEEARRVTGDLVQHLRELGLPVVGWALCPHHPAVTDSPYGGACHCRKPAPGMLLALARRHDLDLARSWMVGDHVTDVQAGLNAGSRAALVLTGHGVRYRDEVPPTVPVLGSLADLPDWLRSAGASPASFPPAGHTGSPPSPRKP